ncbi:MAG: ABC transporter ATP-binding protein [Candidatus Omnitrophica bacterium]|nr:ABC transporter ATP-binding protein [Candidatus Omnitrophota bacterium]MBU1924072.1 ABC transporter ATP-binding protein [Candidatus Omnitrophota bacterium]
MPIIKFKDVWEMYRIKFIIEGKASWENFWALQEINFSMEKGELLGIIGENGSGKSTILRLIAGMLKPDRGGIEVAGSVSGLLELGAGFQIELTGRENISLQCELFGLRVDQAKERFQQIIDFAEIGKFINAPVKCYSQGMFVRLAFAIAVHMDSDIFLVDDTLSVGDEYFQKKCIKEIFKIKQRGKTVIIVTHDMAMLQKLCARTIFLKRGMLIKDEETAKAVSFYSQTVGSPKGIAIIERNRFSLVFNNGKLLLNWDGKLITPSSGGGYTVFGVSGVGYNSSQAEWDVQVSNSQLVATGRFYHLAMAQIWRIEVCENYEIKWDIEIELENDVQLPEVYASVMLSDEYKKWFIDSERGMFPEITEEDKNWKTVFLKNGSNICIGVYPQDSSLLKLPSLLFEQSRLGYLGQGSVLNADYFNPSRILQYKMIPVSTNPVNQANRFICFAGKIMINNPDINDYISKLQNEFVISSGNLKLKFDNGQLGIFFDNIPLTKANNMFTAFFTNQRWYSSDSARWILVKESENRLIARGNWDGLGISQVWRIEICDDCSFTWDVVMQVKQNIELKQQRLRCLFSEDYKVFFSEYASEKFSDTFNDTEVDLLQRCIPMGQVGLQDYDGKLPVVSLSFSEETGNFVKVFNSDCYIKARLIHLEKVESEEKAMFPPGQYECFKVRFSVGRSEPINRKDFDNVLKDGNLKFVFDKGSGRLYRNGKEITKNIALYTSLRLNNRWYDSFSSALWKIVYKSGNQIKAVGKWLDLPLSQEWEFLMKDSGQIEWNVVMLVGEELALDRLQANVMLSEIFTRWTGGQDEGAFPAFAPDIDDDWDCVWQIQDNGQLISLKEDTELNLPRISLAPKKINPGWGLKIINSDQYHRGRVLQYSTSLKTTFLPGSYAYFSGILTMRDK